MPTLRHVLLMVLASSICLAAQPSLELKAVQSHRVGAWALTYPSAEFDEKMKRWEKALATAEGQVPAAEKAALRAEKDLFAIRRQWQAVIKAHRDFQDSLDAAALKAFEGAVKTYEDMLTRYRKANRSWMFDGNDSHALEEAKRAASKLGRYRNAFAQRRADLKANAERSARVDAALDDPQAEVPAIQALIKQHQDACDASRMRWRPVRDELGSTPQQVRNGLPVTVEFAESLLAEDRLCDNSGETNITSVSRWYPLEIRVRQPAAPENTLCVAGKLSEPGPGCAGTPVADVVVGGTTYSPRELFLLAHPSRFVFVTRETGTDTRKIARGEAALVKEGTAMEVTLLFPDGGTAKTAHDGYSRTPLKGAALSTLKPSNLDVRGTFPDGGPGVLCQAERKLDNDSPPPRTELLRLVPATDPRHAKFSTALDSFWACYEREMTRLDPDNTRGRFLMETYNARTGETVKVEKATRALDRKVCKKCKCSKILKTQQTLTREVCTPHWEAEYSKLQPVFDRLKKLFG